METKNTSNKGDNKSVKINVNYVNFIATLKAEKINLAQENKAQVEKIYMETVHLRPTNTARVSGRNLREECAGALKILLANKKLSLEDYKNLGEKATEILTTGKSNYIRVN
jgi:hypothetical protein